MAWRQNNFYSEVRATTWFNVDADRGIVVRRLAPNLNSRVLWGLNASMGWSSWRKNLGHLWQRNSQHSESFEVNIRITMQTSYKRRGKNNKVSPAG